MTSPTEESNNQEQSPPVWKRAMQRPVNLFYYVGLFLVICITFGIIFQFIPFWIICSFILLGFFTYLGFKHGQTDYQNPPPVSLHWFKLILATIGFVAIFGIYLTLAFALKVSFYPALFWGLAYFSLTIIAYVTGYHVGFNADNPNQHEEI